MTAEAGNANTGTITMKVSDETLVKVTQVSKSFGGVVPPREPVLKYRRAR
jgi:hypothetical protein